MSSLKEKSKYLNRLVLDATEFEVVVLEIKIGGKTISEKIVSLNKLNYQPETGKKDFVITFKEIN